MSPYGYNYSIIKYYTTYPAGFQHYFVNFKTGVSFMYDVIPPKSNKNADYTSAALLIISLVAMFFSKLPSLSYRWIMQLCALFMLAMALMLLGRFVFKRYQYSVISGDGGGFDLTVTELTRRSRITVCRISLSGIESVLIVNGSDKTTKKDIRKRSSGRKVFNYCVDMSPAKYICVFAEECGEPLLIKLSYDETLFKTLDAKAI